MSSPKTTLEIIKEYIDAKTEYEQDGIGKAARFGAFQVSSSLTDYSRAIKDRFDKAERQLNEEISKQTKPPSEWYT